MTFFVAGLSYRTTPIELREQLAIAPSKLRCYGCRLKIGAELSEVLLLSTCNRVEVYGTTHRLNGKIDSLFRYLTTSRVDFRPLMYVHQDADAVRHLFRVTSGLDSMVLGETEITGQIKQAYDSAREAGLTGAVLNRAFQKAMQTAKEIRTRTQIGRGATSVGSVAVELAEKIFGDTLAQKTTIIIGAGKMGEACVRHLAKKGATSVLVSNRSFERAQSLAAEFGGRAIRFEECLQAMVGADIVVSSTGCPKTILHKADIETLMRARQNRPLFLIDIAVPRDIDPDVEKLDNVYLYNIDHLESIVRDNMRSREQELALCNAIIEQKTAALMNKLEMGQASRRFIPHRRTGGTPVLQPEKPDDPPLQPQPGWVLCGAAAGNR